MEIRQATIDDCRSIAELALIAGDGIPAWFWEQDRKNGQQLLDVGMQNLKSESENFSYRNVHVAEVENSVAGMILAYRLPDKDKADNIESYPEFIRSAIELEQCVPGSFYINMLATYPKYRNISIGTSLMGIIDDLAEQADSDLISVQVFEQNLRAVRLYKRLGYEVVETRPVVEHVSHPYNTNILLLTRERAKWSVL
jgi:ribosomal protein S18 acetylase RimI-like enzyme